MYCFEALTAFLDSVSDKFGVPACDLLVYKDGKEVYRHLAGFSDAAGTVPASENDLYWIFSSTKVATCTAAMQLIERGVISLDDPVSKYLPKYAHLTVKQEDGSVVPAKNVMTIRHLMTMSSGLDYDSRRGSAGALADEKGDAAGTVEICDAYAEGPLLFEPGTHFHYSLSHDVLAAVIEVASGLRFSEYMEKNIFGPLGMRDTTFHPTEEQIARVSELVRSDDVTWRPQPIGKIAPMRVSPNYESGGGGLVSSTNDYILLGAALANKGTALNGYQLLNPETVELFRTAQLDPVRKKDMMVSFPYMPGYSYALGVRTLVDDRGTPSAIGHFGWHGAAGQYILVDPDNNLTYIYSQDVMNSFATGHYLHNQLRDLVYLALRGDIALINEEAKA